LAVRKILRLPDPALKRASAEIAPEEWELVDRVAADCSRRCTASLAASGWRRLRSANRCG